MASGKQNKMEGVVMMKRKGKRGNGEGSIYYNERLNKWTRTIYG